ncbi:effector binding domain-containing protein [Desulfoscipio sp. XC116]|uniref:effector binding domain-containing protein n=1 Tax=Desulfoscipio sp. XC116 TaxID=3144975 RepID=UPI00325AC515
MGTAKRFFTIIRIDHSDPSRTFCFYGIAAEEYWGDRTNLDEKIIPGSKYAIFKYPEGLGLIFHTVSNDLEKWFKTSGLEFNDNVGINAFELYTEDYKQTEKFYLCISVL